MAGLAQDPSLWISARPLALGSLRLLSGSASSGDPDLMKDPVVQVIPADVTVAGATNPQARVWQGGDLLSDVVEQYLAGGKGHKRYQQFLTVLDNNAMDTVSQWRSLSVEDKKAGFPLGLRQLLDEALGVAAPAPQPGFSKDARLMKLYDELAGGEGGAAAIAALNRALDVVVKKYESLEAVAVTSLQEDLTHLTVSVNSACPLRDDLPCALNNGGRRLRRLDMRRIPGYYGDPSVPAPIHGELLSKLQFGTNTGSVGIAIVNVMGSGKTKAAYDLLRDTFGFYMDASSSESPRFMSAVNKLDSSAATKEADRLMHAWLLSRLLSLFLQVTYSSRPLTAEDWLWYQLSIEGTEFMYLLFSKFKRRPWSTIDTLLAAINECLPSFCDVTRLVVIIDEANVLAEAGKGQFFHPSKMRTLGSPIDPEADLRSVLSVVVHASSAVIPRLVLCGTNLTLASAETLATCLAKDKLVESSSPQHFVVGSLKPVDSGWFRSLLRHCLRDETRCDEFMLPETMFPVRARFCTVYVALLQLPEFVNLTKEVREQVAEALFVWASVDKRPEHVRALLSNLGPARAEAEERLSEGYAKWLHAKVNPKDLRNRNTQLFLEALLSTVEYCWRTKETSSELIKTGLCFIHSDPDSLCMIEEPFAVRALWQFAALKSISPLDCVSRWQLNEAMEGASRGNIMNDVFFHMPAFWGRRGHTLLDLVESVLKCTGDELPGTVTDALRVALPTHCGSPVGNDYAESVVMPARLTTNALLAAAISNTPTILHQGATYPTFSTVISPGFKDGPDALFLQECEPLESKDLLAVTIAVKTRSADYAVEASKVDGNIATADFQCLDRNVDKVLVDDCSKRVRWFVEFIVCLPHAGPSTAKPALTLKGNRITIFVTSTNVRGFFVHDLKSSFVGELMRCKWMDPVVVKNH